MLVILTIIGAIFTQTDWVGGPGVLGPVPNWNKDFYEYDSVTYNIQGRICPVATDVNPNAWVKHIIDYDSNIADMNSLVPGDFDNDGRIDLVGAKGWASTIVFYKNLGDTFVQVSSFAGGGVGRSTYLSVNYIDNDLLIDVVVSGPSGELAWFENTGGFNFTPHIISSTTYYGFVETGDVDNDGDIDLVTGTGTIDVWKNDGSGGFTKTQTILNGACRLRLDDLDGDGDLDLINAYYWGGGITTIYFNDGTGNFSSSASLSSGGVDAMWSRDFDNDGDQDILTGEFQGGGNNYIHWWENDGSGQNYTSHTVYSGGSWLYGDGAFAEDMDMDGKTDVLSGYERLGYFRQITLDNFTEYVIDPALPNLTHWIRPSYRGMCFTGIDVFVSCEDYFLWYENQMAQDFAHGWFTSSVLEIHSQQRQLRWFGWEACVPHDSTLAFYWRADNTAGGIVTKPWIGPHYPIVGEIIRDSIYLPHDPCYRYFQYKAEFWPSAGDVSIVYEIWLTDTTCGAAGVEEEFRVESLELKAYPNPSFGNALIKYGLPEKAAMTLRLYDISGRLVKTLYSGTQEKGYYKVDIKQDELKGGIYFVIFETDDYKATRKLTILR